MKAEKTDQEFLENAQELINKSKELVNGLLEDCVIESPLEKWKKATNELSQEFVNIVYNEDELDEDRIIINNDDWIGGDIGGVLNIGDGFYSLNSITEAIKLKMTSSQVFNYHDYSMDCTCKREVAMNQKNWLKWIDGKKE